MDQQRAQENGTRVFTGRLFPDGTPHRVETRDGSVHSVGRLDRLDEPAGAERWVAPGFFDLQVNGFAGCDLPDPKLTVADLRRMAEALLATGTTRFLPTIITNDLDAMCGQLARLADAMEADPLVGAICPGMHVEGPFIHPEDGPRGAHPRAYVREPNVADFCRLYEACRGKMAVLTLSADWPTAPEVIAEACERGVLVAVGHHRAEPQALEAAIRAGARMVTHLGNGADAMLPRLDNCIWRQLGDDRLWASFIADGHHLPPATLRCMLRAKGLGRSVLITDAMAAAGMPPGEYPLGDTCVVKTPAGKVCLPGTPYLAGSAADMPLVVGRAIVDGGLSVAEGLRLAATQPAVLRPGPDDPWACEPGRRANLVEFDWAAEVGEIRIRQAAIGPFSLQVPSP